MRLIPLFWDRYNRWVLASQRKPLGPCKCARFRAKQAYTNHSFSCLPAFAYPGCQRVFFLRSEAAIVSGEAAIVIHAREKKNPLDAAVTSLTSMRFWNQIPYQTGFLRDLFVFDKSARGATMRETAQIIARWRKAKLLSLKDVIKVRRVQECPGQWANRQICRDP